MDVLHLILEECIKEKYVNARKIAKRITRKFGIEINTRNVGRILKKLKENGFIEIYRDRRGRFRIYKVTGVTEKLNKTKN